MKYIQRGKDYGRKVFFLQKACKYPDQAFHDPVEKRGHEQKNMDIKRVFLQVIFKPFKRHKLQDENA